MLSGTHRNSVQEQVIYGRPALDALTELAKAFGARRLMITSTASLAGPGGLAERLAKGLGAACVGIFADISAHSPREGVIAGAASGAAAGRRSARRRRRRLGDRRHQGHAAGPMDRDRDRRRPWPVPRGPGPDRVDVVTLAVGVRMVAVPTTLSAAEFTPFAGVTDVSRHSKEGYAHPLLAPRAVILDPAMTLTTPPWLWFSTGMKAVDHAVEQLCNPIRSPYADALAEAGLERLARALRRRRKAAPTTSTCASTARSACGWRWPAPVPGAAWAPATPSATPWAATFGVPHGLTSCSRPAGRPAVERGRRRGPPSGGSPPSWAAPTFPPPTR